MEDPIISSFGARKVLFVAPVLASLAAVAAFALSSSEVAVAADTTPAVAASNCTYYNNAAHSVVVGQFGYDCCNNKVAWGHKTQFSVCGGCFVCIPPPP